MKLIIYLKDVISMIYTKKIKCKRRQIRLYLSEAQNEPANSRSDLDRRFHQCDVVTYTYNAFCVIKEFVFQIEHIVQIIRI